MRVYICTLIYIQIHTVYKARNKLSLRGCLSEGTKRKPAARIFPIMDKGPCEERKFIAALDVGTTTIRCHIYDQNAQVCGVGVDQVELTYPQPGFVEIDNEKLWNSVVTVIKNAMKGANVTAENIACLGVSVQRSSFTTWHRISGEAFHNIVTWRDIRADKLVHTLNNSLALKSMRIVCKFLYYITGHKRFLIGSVLKIMNAQVTPRLLWQLQNNSRLKEAVDNNMACFGTLDTWLIHQFTNGRLHVTDVSNASCTGFYDPFVMSWSSWAFHMLQIPSKILPAVVDSTGDFGETAPEIFGSPIPITCCVADQSASLFGSCSFSEGDMKITLGTGTFLDVNTGKHPHGSISGIYPVVGWRIQDEVVYLAEGSSNDTGTAVKWAQKIGIIKDPSESSDMAKSVKDTDGVCFVPSFNGLQAPVNDVLAAAGLIGIKPTTSKAHMIRAILESIAFRVQQLFEISKCELGANYNMIRIDGGVSKNDFLCQLIADLTETPVERLVTSELSALGACYLAGLAAGVWKSREELKSFKKIEKVFQPRQDVKEEYSAQIQLWQNALNRFLRWYPEHDC